MNPDARPLDRIAVAAVIVCCLSWGMNQAAIKLALPEIPPLVQAVVRSCGALAILLTWCRMRGVRLFLRDGTLVPGILLGLLFALEFVMVYRGLLMTTVGRGTTFYYTAPFFVAFGGIWLLPGERLGHGQWGGLILSFIGVVVAITTRQIAAGGGGSTFWGDIMLLVAGAAWGIKTLLVKTTPLAKIAAEKTLIYQLAVSLPILMAASLACGETIERFPGPAALGWLAYQAIWVVGVTYAVWYALVKHYPANRLSAFTFLTPLFAVAAGYAILGERITWPFATAVGLVVVGLILVNRPR